MKRLFQPIALLLLVFILSRSMIRFLPGNPIDTLILESGTKLPRELLQSKINLDESFWVSLLSDAKNALRGDFGISFINSEPVSHILKEHFFPTFHLSLLGLSIALVFSLILGIASAYFKSSTRFNWINHLCTNLGAISAAIPKATLGPIVLYLFIIRIPVFNLPLDNHFSLKTFLLPACVLAFGLSGIWSRLIRERMAESLKSNAVQSARARGLSECVVVFKYGFIPVSSSIVSYIGTQLGHILGGSFIVEVVFNIKGLGTLLVSSALSRDYMVFEACVFLTAAFSLLGIILGDSLKARILHEQ